MKRDFDDLELSDYVDPPRHTDNKRVLWVPDSIASMVPWIELGKSKSLLMARMKEIEGVIDVTCGNADQPAYMRHGFDLILDDTTPEAVIKLRLLKALDFWGMWPQSWKNAHAFSDWVQSKRKEEATECVS